MKEKYDGQCLIRVVFSFHMNSLRSDLLMHSLIYDNLSTVLNVHNLTYLQSYLSTISPVDMESHPWSNNSPRGVLVLVLRACFPSIASKAWYIKRPTAHSRYTILGAYKEREVVESLVYYHFIYLHTCIYMYHPSHFLACNVNE